VLRNSPVMVILALATALMAPTRALADPVSVFSNLSQGANYRSGYWDIAFRSVGFGFIPTVDATFQSLTLSLARKPEGESLPFPDADPTITLFQSAGGAPGSALESFHVDHGDLSEVLSPFPTVTLSSSAHPLLRAGELYWIATAAPSGLTFWVSASAPTVGPAAFRPNGADEWSVVTRNQIGGFSVLGDLTAPAEVPEPASMLLVATGVAGVVRAGTRRRLAATVAP
jgi:hypothetical protein